VGATGARPPYALDDIVQAVVSVQHFGLTVLYEMQRLRDINYAKVCCAVLCCAVLCCAVLCCAVLCCATYVLA
jgi:hypothetical protein